MVQKYFVVLLAIFATLYWQTEANYNGPEGDITIYDFLKSYCYKPLEIVERIVVLQPTSPVYYYAAPEVN